MDAKDFEIERLQKRILRLEEELENYKQINEEQFRIIGVLGGTPVDKQRGYFINDKGIQPK